MHIPGAFPGGLTNVNGTLYLTANDGTSGYGLWKSDGSEAGNVRANDIDLGSDGSSPRNLTNVSGTLFFTAGDSIHGRELWILRPDADLTFDGSVNATDAGAMFVNWAGIGGT